MSQNTIGELRFELLSRLNLHTLEEYFDSGKPNNVSTTAWYQWTSGIISSIKKVSLTYTPLLSPLLVYNRSRFLLHSTATILFQNSQQNHIISTRQSDVGGEVFALCADMVSTERQFYERKTDPEAKVALFVLPVKYVCAVYECCMLYVCFSSIAFPAYGQSVLEVEKVQQKTWSSNYVAICWL